VDADAVNQFAEKLREEQRGKWLETDRLGGFCMMIKRETLHKIGRSSPASPSTCSATPASKIASRLELSSTTRGPANAR